MGNKTSSTNNGYGITEEDMGQIEQFLEKGIHDRSVDDLRPEADQ